MSHYCGELYSSGQGLDMRCGGAPARFVLQCQGYLDTLPADRRAGAMWACAECFDRLLSTPGTGWAEV